MTTLTITPNYDKKRLKFTGTVAAGEHVAVTVAGGGAWIGEGKSLRLRVICAARTVAKFPFWTEENEDDWPEDVTSADAWESANEGADATCVLNLNTVPAAKVLRFGGMCLWVLDDAENHTLYGSGEYIVEPWPKERGEDEPYNLDEYPDIVAELGERIDAAEESIADKVDEANGIVAYVTAARNDAQSAAQTAGTARNQAVSAKGAAEDAQTAAETAQGKAEGAQTAAEAAQVAAEAAQAAAEAALPLDTTLSTEGKAADAEAVGNALNLKADKATTLAGYGITDALISNGAIILGSNSITPLTSHQDISGYVNGGSYDSTNKKILLKHNSTTIAEIDATAFIKDGMVSSVEIDDGDLVITFNTDAGLEPIEIPLTDIFDPADYYDKDAVDGLLDDKVDAVDGKGLSTNDYTDAEKSKLGGIAAGAEVNIIETVKVNGTALTPSSKAVDITVPTVPTNVSAFTNDAGYLTAHQSWNDVKPSGGITASDLASAVQTSLGKADTALQQHQDITGKADKVANAINGNLAALDANGNLTDSGNVVQGIFGCGELLVGYYPNQRYVDILGQGAVSDHCTIIVYNSDSLRHYHYIALPNSDGADKESIFALEREIAPAFDYAANYAEGALVYYNDVLYRCTTAVTTAGGWTGSTNWTEATVEDVLAALRTALAGKQDALSAAQLANIAAVPNKADASALRYAFAATIEPTAGTAAPTGTLTDRAGNKVVCTEATGQTGDNAKLTLTLPPAVPGYVRDFLVKIDRTTSGCYTVDFVPYGNESVRYETEDGSMPEVPDGKVTWLSFTESESGGVFAVRATPLVAVTGGS